MNSLYLSATQKDPEVIFDAEKGTMEIKGKLLPEDGWKYFTPLLEWFEAYVQDSPKPETLVTIAFEYINTSASKCVLKFLQQLDKAHSEGKTQVTINWIHDPDDVDMQEAGEEYQAILSMDLNIFSEEI